MKYNITTYIWILASILLLSSCNSTKYVPDGKHLLTKNSIEVNGEWKTEKKLTPYILQRPNKKLLRVLPLSLYLYNLGNKNYEKKWDIKIRKYTKPSNVFSRVFSLKQAVGYANFRKRLNKWFLEKGEPPVLLDETKANKTLQNLKRYHIYQGYFKTKGNYIVDSVAPKKSHLTYQITTDRAFTIDSLKYEIASPVIDSLYRIHKANSLIKEKQQFQRQNFEKEADRLTKIFRNAGVYHFSKYAINFRDIDSTNTNYKTPVVLDISNRIIEEGDSLIEIPYEITTIKKVKVYTDYSFLKRENTLKDSINYEGIDYYAYTHINYKPKHLSKAIFIKPGDKYSDKNTELTRHHLIELDNFKSIYINYEEVEKNELVASILLTPSKRYGLKTEVEWTHSNEKPFGISGKISAKNNNTFQGNEIFELGFQGSFLNSTKFVDENKFFNAWEMGVDASLKIPRFVLPFQTERLIPKRMSPKTILTLGTSFHENIGLDKQRFTAIFKYNWHPNKKVINTLELFNGQYIKNLNPESFFDIYSSEYQKLQNVQSKYFPNEPLSSSNAPHFITTTLADNDFHQNQPEEYLSVQNVKKRYDIITENILVPTITYQWLYNSQTDYRDVDYSYFRIRLVSSGLLTSLLAKTPEQGENKQVLGINVAQYLKLDMEYREHWELDYNNTLAYRGSLGIAIPYGNSTSIPFSRSYFAGGPNDIRAWRIYELGPGGNKKGLEFNVGNFKLLSSLEYRFNILGSLKGAFFVDAGNIWDITDSDLLDDSAKFQNFSSLKNIAVGSGFGMRYDLSFLVFRIDLGFKTYEPYNLSGKKWFYNYNFANAVLNIGVNYPF